MNIFIDESGSFVHAPRPGHWNCVAAYVSPETDRRKLRAILKRVKKTCTKKKGPKDEIKLRDLSEQGYFDFLNHLTALRGVLFAVAIDAGIHTNDEVSAHKIEQAAKIDENKDKMHHEQARRAVEDFADQIRHISNQLYVQLFCHVFTILAVLNRGVLYFVQRIPNSLGTFRWRIDQKNSSKNVFEDSYLKLALPLLQTISFRMPFPKLEGADYSRFDRFVFPPGQAPTYLKDTFGIKADDNNSFNLGKFLRENLRFQDSLVSEGIQVADLLASGLRRCLRGGFVDNRKAAHLLGSLMVQDADKQPPLQLIAFGQGEDVVADDKAAEAVRLMKNANRSMRTRA